MAMKTLLVILIVLICSEYGKSSAEDPSGGDGEARVMIAFFVRNKAHTLPYFLYYLEQLDYPKEKLLIWIRSDHNMDTSAEIVRAWVSAVRHQYYHISFKDDDSSTGYADEKSECDWSKDRMANMIRLRQEALDAARDMGIKYLMMIDADNILTNSQVLRHLISRNVIAVSPMLNATASEHYSNFWCGMDEKGYYKRTSDYKPIQERHIMGTFTIPMIHSTLLINLHAPQSQFLNYDPPPPEYNGPIDDIIIFAMNARHYGVPLHIVNDDLFGFQLVPMEAHNSLSQEVEQFVHVKLQNIIADTPLQKLDYLPVPPPKMSKLGFDQIYVINLVRRPDRRAKMEACLRELNLEYKIVDAVDGKLLNKTYLEHIGYQMLPGYEDPHLKRSMTMGEIGCFLSHYFAWQDMLARGYQRAIILEDDVRFKPYFETKLYLAQIEAKKAGINWDLMYLGRKVLDYKKEYYVENADGLVWPYYSYWTIGYALTYTGAWKLVSKDPVSKMIPVDEYLPLMYDQNPEESWKPHFEPRDLVAISPYPVVLEPTHYTGEPGYFTDTEESVIAEEAIKHKGDEESLEDYLASSSIQSETQPQHTEL